jgi:hypothetical protein
MEVELDPLTLLEMGMGEDNIEIEVNRKSLAVTGRVADPHSFHPDPEPAF